MVGQPVNGRDIGPSRISYPEWAGSPGYTAACRSMRSVPDDPAELSSDGQYLAVTMADLLVDARPVVCPPSQLSAIDEEVFSNFASAADYAADTQLPFPSILFDFTPPPGGAYPVVEVGGRRLTGSINDGGAARWEIAGLIAGNIPESEGHVFLPLFVDPESGGLVPIGCALFRPGDPEPSSLPGQYIEGGPNPRGSRAPASFNGATVQKSLREDGPPARGAYLGIGVMNGSDDETAASATQAVISAVAFRMALKVMFLLDSVNIELADVELTRQSRRQASRKGRSIASMIQVRRSKSRPTASEDPAPANFEHQFEVRGNFAHYGPDTQLFRRSEPDHIRACPRCGRCRRVWRPPHIKGPADKPLVVKVREVAGVDLKGAAAHLHHRPGRVQRSQG